MTPEYDAGEKRWANALSAQRQGRSRDGFWSISVCNAKGFFVKGVPGSTTSPPGKIRTARSQSPSALRRQDPELSADLLLITG